MKGKKGYKGVYVFMLIRKEEYLETISTVGCPNKMNNNTVVSRGRDLAYDG